MKPVQKPKVVPQPPVLPMSQPQGVTDEQVVQVLNKLRTKAQAAQIAIEEIMGESAQLFITIMNQKNKEITELKEEMAKKEIEKKLDQKVK